MRWVGIDEAGYGPNLGPMVMTAVVAEGPDGCIPDVWGDLGATVARAGDATERLWVDDSKAILRLPSGRARLEATCLALLAAAAAAGRGNPFPRPVQAPMTMAGLLAAVGAGTIADAELTPWLEPDSPEYLPHEGPGQFSASLDPHPAEASASTAELPELDPFAGAAWRITGVHAVVVGPARFNDGLAATGSKAKVHFAAFARLLGLLWDSTGAGTGAGDTHVRSDKHGGRHYYYEPLIDAFPGLWIDRGCESPDLSRYTLRASGRRLELCLQPRADSADGLVALASIVSKTIRERWMDLFNAHWIARIPGLVATAGYPVDAQRFRRVIEPHCSTRGLDPSLWWRLK